MSVKLDAVCYYRTISDDWTDKWKNDDYKALKLVKATKNHAFKHYVEFKINNKTYKINDTPNGKKVAMAISGFLLANLIKKQKCEGMVLIPIPSSSHTDPNDDFTGLRIANSIVANGGGVNIRPELYFNNKMSKSSEGGSRNPRKIEANLRARNLDGIDKAILLDDVFTTGAHAKASIMFLRSKGVEVVHCFVIGRTFMQRPNNMFEVRQENIVC